MSIVSAIFRRILQANPWDTTEQFRLTRLVSDLEEWYDFADIPPDMRIGGITEKMIPPATTGPHPGGMMKVKAA
eukprot:8075307-Pyramimonas_sp.AAC.1